MSTAWQGSLLDAGSEPAVGSLAGAVRTRLAEGAWIDVLPAWLTGADELFERLVTDVPWRAERRRMYERDVDVPRLMHFCDDGDALPDPILYTAKDALTSHYRSELGEEFATAGLCYYRDGTDSVAWHGDRIGRGATHDTMVAIVSLGASRDLLLRPAGGGRARRHHLGHGDLLVMGGSCQRTPAHGI